MRPWVFKWHAGEIFAIDLPQLILLSDKPTGCYTTPFLFVPPPVRISTPDRYFFPLVALLALFGWTAPLHILPWTGFYNEWPLVAALFLLAIAALRGSTSPLRLPALVLLPVLLALVPLLQFATGKIFFRGDAVMATLYLLALGLACTVGFWLDARFDDRFVQGLAATLLAGALISLLLASQQWLGVTTFGIWVTDLRPGGRPYANLAQPNNLATLLYLGLAATVYLREQGQLRRGLFWLAAVLLMAGIAMTRSRTALVTAVVVLVGLLLWRRRLQLKTGALESVAGFALCIALWALWPTFSEWLQIPIASRLEEALSGGKRWVIWQQLLDAALQQPWLGWGWNQVSVAQMSVAAGYPQSEVVEHAHNIVLDLLLWNGVLLGSLIAAALALWFIVRSVRLDSQAGWFGLLALLVVGSHAMFEFPLDYAYFLLPLGLCVGMVEHRSASTTLVHLPRAAMITAIALVCALATAVFIDYRTVEADYRQMRFEGAGIAVRPAEPTASNVWLLTQQREYIRLARTPAHEGMSRAQLDWMRRVVHRFPVPPALFRYALALGLNGEPDEARLQLARLRQLHPPAHHEEAMENLRLMAKRYPQLEQVLLTDGEREDKGHPVRRDEAGKRLEVQFLYPVRRSAPPGPRVMGRCSRGHRSSVDRGRYRLGIELRNQTWECRPRWVIGKATQTGAPCKCWSGSPQSFRPGACTDVFCAEPGRPRARDSNVAACPR